MSTVATRAKSLLSHKNPFGFPAEEIFSFDDLMYGKRNKPSVDEQYILRMMVGSPNVNGRQIPTELNWLKPLIEACSVFQARKEINNPFIYVTVRHGIVKSVTDDLWHVDGFSMRVPHIPEQNYIYASHCGTEVLEQTIQLPEDFDPMRHNIHQYFQDVAKEENVKVLRNNTLYRIDPYVVHRRPKVTEGVMRTFVRISFIPIEIEDDTCTVNPLIPRLKPYNRSDIRNLLQRYPV